MFSFSIKTNKPENIVNQEVLDIVKKRIYDLYLQRSQNNLDKYISVTGCIKGNNLELNIEVSNKKPKTLSGTITGDQYRGAIDYNQYRGAVEYQDTSAPLIKEILDEVFKEIPSIIARVEST